MGKATTTSLFNDASGKIQAGKVLIAYTRNGRQYFRYDPKDRALSDALVQNSAKFKEITTQAAAILKDETQKATYQQEFDLVKNSEKYAGWSLYNYIIAKLFAA